MAAWITRSRPVSLRNCWPSTRCGDLDPGVVPHLIQQKGMSAEALVDLLYRRSGVLGLSGISSDFRGLLASDNPRARFVVEVFGTASPATPTRQ